MKQKDNAGRARETGENGKAIVIILRFQPFTGIPRIACRRSSGLQLVLGS